MLGLESRRFLAKKWLGEPIFAHFTMIWYSIISFPRYKLNLYPFYQVHNYAGLGVLLVSRADVFVKTASNIASALTVDYNAFKLICGVHIRFRRLLFTSNPFVTRALLTSACYSVVG